MSDRELLRNRTEELITKHGGVRAAARVLNINAGYLSRLRSGVKVNPSPKVLRRMKLRRVIYITNL